jgi:hypothetical protein
LSPGYPIGAGEQRVTKGKTMWITAIEALTNSQPASEGEFSLLWSLIVPGLILLCSVILTWLLYRHFKKSS